jgi:hypothetical protein
MPLTLWATHVLQWSRQRAATPQGQANLIKLGLSSDCRLQLAGMKEESLVIAGQHTAVNPFPGLVHTARHTMEAGHARSRYPNRSRRGTPKAGLVTGVKS